jgi:ABC-type lipoprotein release transport system permease subunit
MLLTCLRRELCHRPRQTAVVSLGLALGVGMVIAVTAVSSGFEEAEASVLGSLYGVGTDIAVTQVPAEGDAGSPAAGVGRLLTGGLGPIESSRVAVIADTPGVAVASGGLTLTELQIGDPGEGPSAGPRTVAISGVGLDQVDVGPLGSSTVVAGRALAPGDHGINVAVVEAGYAEQRGVGIGSTVMVAETAFEVVGTVRAEDGRLPSDLFVPLAAAQRLLGLSDQVNTIYVAADSSAAVGAVRAEISRLLPSATVTTSGDLGGAVSGSLADASGLAGTLGVWLAAIVVLAAFLAAAVLTLTGVSRRVREIGTLKSLGWTSRRIVGQIMAESAAKGVLGAMAGVVLGCGAAATVTALAPTLSGSVDQAPASGGAAIGAVDVGITAPVTLSRTALAVAVALAGGLTAGMLGGWRAARLRPADALART